MLSLLHMTCLAALPVVLLALERVYQHIRREHARKKAGCLPAAQYPHKEPFLGLDLFRAWTRAEAKGQPSQFFVDLHNKYGRTFEMKMCGPTEVHLPFMEHRMDAETRRYTPSSRRTCRRSQRRNLRILDSGP